MPESNTSNAGRELLASRLLHQVQQSRLFCDVPIGIAGAVVRQHSHSSLFRPIAKAGSGHRGQMLNNRRGKHLEEEVFIGFLVAPAPPRLFLSLRARTHGNQNCGVCPGLLERAVQALAIEDCAVNSDRIGIGVEFQALRLPRIKPRPAILRIPVPRPVC